MNYFQFPFQPLLNVLEIVWGHEVKRRLEYSRQGFHLFLLFFNGFKKVAFFFGRRLQRDALIPIGLISAAVGGSRIETWLNQEPYQQGGNYTKLIGPLVGYGMRGVLWYQGESNANDRRGYQPKLESLITGWRKVFRKTKRYL